MCLVTGEGERKGEGLVSVPPQLVGGPGLDDSLADTPPLPTQGSPCRKYKFFLGCKPRVVLASGLCHVLPEH